MENDMINLKDLEIRAAKAEAVTWEGRQAIRLEDGLALAPEARLKDASIEVLIGTEGPAYPGRAFRIADILNYELAYAVPHVSGQWDALQYDPVFHGSNTWQLYHGPNYQREAEVTIGRWFRLKVETFDHLAAISVDGGTPLVVAQLAHPVMAGRFGLWTFRPAYFSDMQISSCKGLEMPDSDQYDTAQGIVESWFVEGYGVVTCEPNGVINLNRHFPISLKKARLVRQFETSESGEITLAFGFSDVLTLKLDDAVIFKGENKFTGFADRAARGYVELGMETVQKEIAPGKHILAAELEVTEGFGWGLTLAARGSDLHWLPAELG